MTWLTALLPLIAATGPVVPGSTVPARGGSPAIRSVASPLVRQAPPRTRGSLRPARELRVVEPLGAPLALPAGAERPLVCTDAACPPRLDGLPGDPRPPQGTRRDLVLALLARMPFEKLSSAATAIADAPIQIDYTPGGTGRERGWGRLNVALRWRLDATGPVRSSDDEPR